MKYTQSHPTLREVPIAPPQPTQPLAVAPCHVLTSPPPPSPSNGIPCTSVNLDIPIILPPSTCTQYLRFESHVPWYYRPFTRGMW